MIALWYGILAFMLTTYIVLDGRNFGAGVLHWIVARNQAERRQVIAAIGPLWSWHEVWLVGTGGVTVMAFPRLMAVSFSGCYLALFLILWCVLLLGISSEVCGHLGDRLRSCSSRLPSPPGDLKCLGPSFCLILFLTENKCRRMFPKNSFARQSLTMAGLYCGRNWFIQSRSQSASL